jgi:hypothetical protein
MSGRYSEWPEATAIRITKSQVDSGDFISVAAVLLALSSDHSLVIKKQNALSLVVTGYEDDTRRIIEIPEVAEFFCHLTSIWPFWLHFLRLDDHSAGLALTLWMGILGSALVNGKLALKFGDSSDTTKALLRSLSLMSSAMALRECHGLPRNAELDLEEIILTVLC